MNDAPELHQDQEGRCLLETSLAEEGGTYEGALAEAESALFSLIFTRARVRSPTWWIHTALNDGHGMALGTRRKLTSSR